MVGRPVKTWRRSVEEELKQANHLEYGKKNNREQSPLAQYSVRPLFHEETNGLTTNYYVIERSSNAVDYFCVW